MKIEDLSNFELIQLFKNVVIQGDGDYALEIQEEIFTRMEDKRA